MSPEKLYDPYAEILDLFNKKGIHYVVVGMSGINYYAASAKETFTTQDFDIHVKPTIKNVKDAIAVLKDKGYDIVVGEDLLRDKLVKKVVQERKTILANDSYGILFELILEVSGFNFKQMASDAKIFQVNNIPIRVAKLSKLLTSKKIAGRKKDKLLLERYKILLEENERDN